jgi:prepilin-type N-terminal cleavage/methylation domain-containing protein/prepilin-type processing-associated H-X9-DG protein
MKWLAARTNPPQRGHPPFNPAGRTDLLAWRQRAFGPGAFTLVELLVVISVIAILASLIMPTVGRVKAKARDTQCLNNLKQLGIAVVLYAEENGNKLPKAELKPSNPIDSKNPDPRLRDLLARYLANNAEVFRCPADKQDYFVKEGSSYEWNVKYNEQKPEILREPIPVPSAEGQISYTNTAAAIVPLIYDYENFHSGKTRSTNSVIAGFKNALYADGHVAAIKAY